MPRIDHDFETRVARARPRGADAIEPRASADEFLFQIAIDIPRDASGEARQERRVELRGAAILRVGSMSPRVRCRDNDAVLVALHLPIRKCGYAIRQMRVDREQRNGVATIYLVERVNAAMLVRLTKGRTMIRSTGVDEAEHLMRERYRSVEMPRQTEHV